MPERRAIVPESRLRAWASLGASAVAVLSALSLHLRAGQAWPSVETLAAMAGCSRATVLRVTARAVAAGLLRVTARGPATPIYEVLDPPADMESQVATAKGSHGATSNSRSRASKGSHAKPKGSQSARKRSHAAIQTVEANKTNTEEESSGPLAPRAPLATPERTAEGARTMKKLRDSPAGRELIARAVAAGIDPRAFVEELVAERGTGGRVALGSPVSTFAAALDAAESVPS